MSFVWTILKSEVVKSDDRIRLFVHHPCWLNICFFISHFGILLNESEMHQVEVLILMQLNNVSGNPLIYMVVYHHQILDFWGPHPCQD